MTRTIVFALLLMGNGLSSYAQLPERLKDVFPSTITIHGDLSYAGDTLKKHTLDIYVPPGGGARHPLVVWVHGGAWMMNDKYADMGYMKGTIKRILDAGYALASINYRYSTEAVFPAQIQDCNQALEWLYQHADQYSIDRPDLARRASPVTYIDKDDPPFLIVQGEKDESVPNTQSKILHSWLTLAGVPNDIIVVPNAPHYGEMFDAEYIREKLMSTL